ncbi:MAG: cobyric acid synthase [Microbacteriaceae bacterium]|nr:cobyric acid synthase [Microbacteriaceae bacterium]
MTTLSILHLYPRELGINGDVGNVLALRRRAEWRDIDVQVIDHEIGDQLTDAPDLVFIGSGPLSAQLAVHDDLLRIAPTLRKWAAEGVPMLAITAGWQLFGTQLTLADGTVLDGAGVLPSTARLIDGRTISEMTGTGRNGDLMAGFENHGAIMTLSGGEPLMTVGYGKGNTGLAAEPGDRVEGLVDGANIGTNLHGPFLPMNPAYADLLLASALARTGASLPAADARVHAVDLSAEKAREAVVGRVGS